MGEIRSIFIGLMLLTLVITGFTTFWGGINDEYGTVSEPALAKYENISRDMLNVSGQMKDKMDTSDISANPASDNVFATMPGAWDAAKLVYLSINSVSTVVSVTAGIVGLPDWFVLAIVGILGVILVFTFVGVLLKWNL